MGSSFNDFDPSVVTVIVGVVRVHEANFSVHYCREVVQHYFRPFLVLYIAVSAILHPSSFSYHDLEEVTIFADDPSLEPSRLSVWPRGLFHLHGVTILYLFAIAVP